MLSDWGDCTLQAGSKVLTILSLTKMSFADEIKRSNGHNEAGRPMGVALLSIIQWFGRLGGICVLSIFKRNT